MSPKDRGIALDYGIRMRMALIAMGLVTLVLSSSCGAVPPPLVTYAPSSPTLENSSDNSWAMVAASSITATVVPSDTWLLVPPQDLASNDFGSLNLDASAPQPEMPQIVILTQYSTLGSIPPTAVLLMDSNMLNPDYTVLGNVSPNTPVWSNDGQIQMFLSDKLSSPGNAPIDLEEFAARPAVIVDFSTGKMITGSRDIEYRIEFRKGPCPNCIPACERFPFSCFCINWPWCMTDPIEPANP